MSNMNQTSQLQDTKHPRHDIQQLIGNTLRWGVTIACLIAFVGGVLYLIHHGGEPMKDYSTFVPAGTQGTETYTTLSGILDGVLHMTAVGWIQLGVIALLLTPILRVALSLLDFLQEHDWLYAGITAIVLSVIILNSVGGIK